MDCEEILLKLRNDEVVVFSSAQENNLLLEYMLDHDIDPDDFRRSGLAIWMA